MEPLLCSQEHGTGERERLRVSCYVCYLGLRPSWETLEHLQPLGLDGSLIEWTHIHSGTRCFPCTEKPDETGIYPVNPSNTLQALRRVLRPILKLSERLILSPG